MYETLYTTPMRHISLTQAVILSSTSNFFATIAALSNIMRLQVKYLTIIPRVRMGSESVGHEAEGRMGY